MIKKLIPSVLLACCLVGCTTTTITNLTPTQYPRNASGQYLVEMQIDTDQKTLRMATVKPSVVIDNKSYEMRQTKKTSNRWETMVPIGADKSGVAFHFVVEYQYDRFGNSGHGTIRSQDYPLVLK